MNLQVVISCEHASNEVPVAYQALFQEAKADLNSHKGWDPGSLNIARYLGNQLHVKPFIYPYTRLLIEVNRSLDSDQLFSAYSKGLAMHEKDLLVHDYYQPYRDKVEAEIESLTKQGPVLHLGIHTFEPFWNGQHREVEVGILFDPDRVYERRYAQLFREQLAGSRFISRENEPYLGISDGFTTYLRTRFEEIRYLGIEIEVSQGLLNGPEEVNKTIGKALTNTIKKFNDWLERGVGR